MNFFNTSRLLTVWNYGPNREHVAWLKYMKHYGIWHITIMNNLNNRKKNETFFKLDSSRTRERMHLEVWVRKTKESSKSNSPVWKCPHHEEITSCEFIYTSVSSARLCNIGAPFKNAHAQHHRWHATAAPMETLSWLSSLPVQRANVIYQPGRGGWGGGGRLSETRPVTHGERLITKGEQTSAESIVSKCRNEGTPQSRRRC